jgi:alpha-L-fucosidase
MENQSSYLQNIDEVAQRGPFLPTWESLRNYRAPQWYMGGKFGIFIHWGLYCVPAFGNEWYPRNMYIRGSKEYQHHLETYGSHSQFGYKDFIPLFKAERFDAYAWAKLFRKAGARFVVPVAEHHDGFPMYDCSFTRWSAAKMGPKRDIIGELAKAVRQEGMVFGVSSHRIEHFWFMNGGKEFDSDVQDPAYDDFYGPAMPKLVANHNLDSEPRPDAAFLNDWLARSCELVDQYQPQLVWFDWWIEQVAARPYLKKFAAYYYNRAAQWDQGVVINHKYEAYPESAAVLDIERGQLKDIRPLVWQNDTSVSKNSWGYIQNQDYKTADSLIHDLVDVVSKNGVLLLNIGPRSDGMIPEPEQNLLLEMGRWLEVNGRAVYNTRPWRIYGEGPTQVMEGAFTDTKRAGFTPHDVRYSTDGKAVYAVLMGYPENSEVVLKALGADLPLYIAEIQNVRLLGADAPLDWKREKDALRVRLPVNMPCEHAYVLEIL